MQYLVFSIGAGAIVLLASQAYKLFERWNRRRRLRGAQECLDAVHYTFAGLAECKSGFFREHKNDADLKCKISGLFRQKPFSSSSVVSFNGLPPRGFNRGNI
jgi:hypothetical protein